MDRDNSGASDVVDQIVAQKKKENSTWGRFKKWCPFINTERNLLMSY